MTERKGNDNPNGVVEGIRKAIQDLLVPELKALQVTVQHLRDELKEHRQQTSERFEKLEQQIAERFEKLERQIAERFEKLEQRTAEQFAKVWQVLNQLLEAQQHNQLVLQRILNRLDVTEMVKETQSRQKVLEAQTEQLREQMAHLQRLLEAVVQQRGIQPMP